MLNSAQTVLDSVNVGFPYPRYDLTTNDGCCVLEAQQEFMTSTLITAVTL